MGGFKFSVLCVYPKLFSVCHKDLRLSLWRPLGGYGESRFLFTLAPSLGFIIYLFSAYYKSDPTVGLVYTGELNRHNHSLHGN